MRRDRLSEHHTRLGHYRSYASFVNSHLITKGYSTLILLGVFSGKRSAEEDIDGVCE